MTGRIPALLAVLLLIACSERGEGGTETSPTPTPVPRFVVVSTDWRWTEQPPAPQPTAIVTEECGYRWYLTTDHQCCPIDVQPNRLPVCVAPLPRVGGETPRRAPRPPPAEGTAHGIFRNQGGPGSGIVVFYDANPPNQTCLAAIPYTRTGEVAEASCLMGAVRDRAAVVPIAEVRQ